MIKESPLQYVWYYCVTNLLWRHMSDRSSRDVPFRFSDIPDCALAKSRQHGTAAALHRAAPNA